MALAVETYKLNEGNIQSYASDKEMFPGITIVFGELGYRVEMSADMEDVWLAHGNTREEAVTALEEHIKNCINTLQALKTVQASELQS